MVAAQPIIHCGQVQMHVKFLHRMLMETCVGVVKAQLCTIITSILLD